MKAGESAVVRFRMGPRRGDMGEEAQGRQEEGGRGIEADSGHGMEERGYG